MWPGTAWSSTPVSTACSLKRPIVRQEDRLFPGSTLRSRPSSPVIRMPAVSIAHGKILVHLKDRRRLVVDAHDVYYLEARGDEADIRLRGARRLLDVRSLGEVMRDFGPAGFVRIHRNHAVNPGRVREISLTGRAWQVQLEPPVNKVLPVSRGSLTKLLQAYRRS